MKGIPIKKSMGEGALSSYASGNSHKKKKTCLCCFKIPSQYKIQKTDLAILEALDLEQLDTLNKPISSKVKTPLKLCIRKVSKIQTRTLNNSV